jgi:hypothetical protein
MSENQEESEGAPNSQPEGYLDPPSRKPPTAVGAEPAQPGDEPREVVLPAFTTVVRIASLISVPLHRLILTAFFKLGQMVTVNDALPFERSKALVAHFGYVARRAGE